MAMLRRSRIPQNVEGEILALAAARPRLGLARVATELTKRGLAATPSTVKSVWHRHGLENTEKRIQAFALPAKTAFVTDTPLPDGKLVILSSQEIPPNAGPMQNLMADFLVFSVAVLSALGQDSAERLGQPTVDNLHPLAQETPLLVDDLARLAHTPMETADIIQIAHSQPDFFV